MLLQKPNISTPSKSTFLTFIHNFSAIILRKKIYAKEVPLFHLAGVIHLIISTLDMVELGWNYGWNFM